jgi:hypothetical protein
VLGLLIGFPFLALVPALLFGALYSTQRRRPLLIAALAWLAYVPYEYGMKLRILCSGECNIRVDLLLLYPILAILSISAVVSAIRARRASATDARAN